MGGVEKASTLDRGGLILYSYQRSALRVLWLHGYTIRSPSEGTSIDHPCGEPHFCLYDFVVFLNMKQKKIERQTRGLVII